MLTEASSTFGAITPEIPTRGSRASVEDLGTTFRQALRAHKDAQDPEIKARDAASDFVAQTLVLPVLAQMREMNDAADPFKPSSGEKQFGALLDQKLAKEITKASSFPLVDRLARDLLRSQGIQPRSERELPADGITA